MIAVIKGDIIGSRRIEEPEQWLKPLKKLLNKWGKTPEHWELVWGDFFQVEISDAALALKKAFEIKALIKSIAINTKNTSFLDVRLALGIGTKEYAAKRISESSGSAFVYAGEIFEQLKREKITLAIKSPWPEFDGEINLYLKLATTIMNKWSVSSAELVQYVLNKPNATQQQLGKIFGIKQNSVSGRYNRAKASEMLELIEMYCKKLNKQPS